MKSIPDRGIRELSSVAIDQHCEFILPQAFKLERARSPGLASTHARYATTRIILKQNNIRVHGEFSEGFKSVIHINSIVCNFPARLSSIVGGRTNTLTFWFRSTFPIKDRLMQSMNTVEMGWNVFLMQKRQNREHW